MRVPKFPQLGIPQLWRPITSHANLQLQWGLKQSCSPHQELFNGVLHVTCTQGNKVDSRLLMVRSQIVNLTPDFSFDHTLCFRCLNGSCKTILDIYVSIAFQWYKNSSKWWVLTPTIAFWIFGSPFGIPTPKMGVHLGVWGFMPSHFFTLLGALNVTPELPSWLVTLQILALVTSPKLGLWQFFSLKLPFLF